MLTTGGATACEEEGVGRDVRLSPSRKDWEMLIFSIIFATVELIALLCPREQVASHF